MKNLISQAGDLADWIATEPGKVALAGAAGGLVRWITLRERPRDVIPAVLVGALCAIYLGPLAEPLLDPIVGAISAHDDADRFAGFVVGLLGIGLTGMLIDLLRAYQRQRDGAGADEK